MKEIQEEYDEMKEQMRIADEESRKAYEKMRMFEKVGKAFKETSMTIQKQIIELLK